jgi:hypothetical protein
MSTPNITQLTTSINAAVNPFGGDPKITGPDLNALLHEMVAELAIDPATLGTAAEPLPYAQALATATGSGPAAFRPGSSYRLTDRPDGALGTAGEVLVTAVGERELAGAGLLLARVPDYQTLPTWFPTYTPLGAPTGETIYTYDIENAYTRIRPQIGDFVESGLSGDDNFKVVPLPFDFTFGGVTYREVCVDSNGRIVFGAANYSSQFVVPALGSQDVPLVAACWTDIVANSPGGISIFVTGKAPHRQFVVDYWQLRYAYNAAYIYSSLDNLQQKYSGQIVLAESDNSIAVGQSENGVTAQRPVFGLQYAGHSYQPYPTGTNAPVNTTVRYRPVTVRTPAAPVRYAGGTPAIWQGRTWDLLGADPTVEPGTDAAQWAPHAAPAADRYGNTVLVGDAIDYDLLTDTIGRRTDGRHNAVAGASCRFFPWGMPGVHDNEVTDTVLDASLLTTPNLSFAHNVLAGCNLSGLRLGGLKVRHNRLYQVTLAGYAPTGFSGVTAVGGLNTDFKDPSNRCFVNGDVLTDPAAALETALTAFKGKYVDQVTTIFKSGQTPVVEPLNIGTPWAQTYVPHDAIEMRGVDLSNSFAFTGQDLNIVGNATLGLTRVAFLMKDNAPGYTMTFNGLNFPAGLQLGTTRGNALSGHNFHFIKCTIASTGGMNTGSPNYLSTYTFSHCVINQIPIIGNGAMTSMLINNACLGRTITSGAIFGGTRAAGNGAFVVTNSTIYLAGTATLFDAALDPRYYPTFRNCTVVAADGTTTTLNTNVALPAAPTSLAGTRTAGTGVHLGWDATPGATMYQLYRSAGGAGFQLLATIPYPYFDDATSEAATAGVALQYYLRAANATGLGAASPTIAVAS